MRSIGPETQAAIQDGGLEIGIIVRAVLRDPTAGSETVLRLWDGAFDREFETERGIESYVGVGAGLVMQPIEQVIGLDVVQARLTLSGASEELVSQILGLDARAAPIEVWQVAMAGRVLDAPVRVFDGKINGLEFITGTSGEPGVIEATLVPRTVDLIHGPTRRWSHASQLARGVSVSTFGAPTIYTTPQTVSIPAGTMAIKVTVVGGGGGGASSFGDGAGGAGGQSKAIVRDGSGNAVATLTAAGGAGGSGSSSTQPPAPPPTPLSPYGDGGTGGVTGGESPSYGLPGDSASDVGWTGSVGSGWSVEIQTIGAGGAGGVGESGIPGNAGNAGAVSIALGSPSDDNFMRWAHVEERTVIWGP